MQKIYFSKQENCRFFEDKNPKLTFSPIFTKNSVMTPLKVGLIIDVYINLAVLIRRVELLFMRELSLCILMLIFCIKFLM